MTEKHSPGPWRVEYRLDGIPFGVSSPAVMKYGTDTLCLLPNKPSAQANAHLIAAAPTLLTMLQRLLDDVLMLPELPKTIAPLDIEQARAAIAKATGH